MRDLHDLETEAEQLAAELREARCCDALTPCNRCRRLRINVAARRRVVEITQPRHDEGGVAVPGRHRGRADHEERADGATGLRAV